MFLQIGNRAINVEEIIMIEFHEIAERQVSIWLKQATDYVTLRDGDYDAFLRWWEEKAEVCRA